MHFLAGGTDRGAADHARGLPGRHPDRPPWRGGRRHRHPSDCSSSSTASSWGRATSRAAVRPSSECRRRSMWRPRSSSRAVAIVVARWFRDSLAGLELRAAREDEPAARAVGVNVPARRLLAWTPERGAGRAGRCSARALPRRLFSQGVLLPDHVRHAGDAHRRGDVQRLRRGGRRHSGHGSHRAAARRGRARQRELVRAADRIRPHRHRTRPRDPGGAVLAARRSVGVPGDRGAGQGLETPGSPVAGTRATTGVRRQARRPRDPGDRRGDEVVRRSQGRGRRDAVSRARRDRRADRTERLRQDHPARLHLRGARSLRRVRRARRRRHQRDAGAPDRPAGGWGGRFRTCACSTA